MPKPFESVSGSYTGDGAGFAVTLGFKPKFVIVYNQTDHDSVSMFIDGMTAGTAINMVGDLNLVAANGITLSVTGFSVGSDNSVCENLKVFKYFAISGN